MSNNKPIGIFDSGIGGLTVFKEIRKVLPKEHILYLGDTARVPYGTKSQEVVKKYSFLNSKFLKDNGVKVIIVACNTASTSALDYLQEKFSDIPIIGVVKPIIDNLIKIDDVFKIGVIGTNTTIESNVYQNKILEKIRGKIISKSCPLFVPLAEEGLTDNHITLSIIDYYLHDMKKQNIDTLILGCTHYPLLKKSLQYYFGDNVKIIDSAYFTARELKKVIIDQKMDNNDDVIGSDRFFVTDSIESFKKTGNLFLGKEIENIQHI